MLTPPGTYILALRYLLSLGAQTISSLPNNVLSSMVYIDVELVCHIEKVELSSEPPRVLSKSRVLRFLGIPKICSKSFGGILGS